MGSNRFSYQAPAGPSAAASGSSRAGLSEIVMP